MKRAAVAFLVIGMLVFAAACSQEGDSHRAEVQVSEQIALNDAVFVGGPSKGTSFITIGIRQDGGFDPRRDVQVPDGYSFVGESRLLEPDPDAGAVQVMYSGPDPTREGRECAVFVWSTQSSDLDYKMGVDCQPDAVGPASES